MSNSYKTIDQLLSETPSLEQCLKDATKYYAHVSPYKDPETLGEHVELVLEKFRLLCTHHQLDAVIDRLIDDFVQKNFSETIRLTVGNFLKKLLVNVVVFHDYGKVNENFQAHSDKMNNPYFAGKLDQKSPLKTYHSALGAYLFIVKHLQEMQSIKMTSQAEQTNVLLMILVMSHPIFRHHGRHLQSDLENKIRFSPEEIKAMQAYIDAYGWQIDPRLSEGFVTHMKKVLNKLSKQKQDFALYALVRLSFSLLTAADFLASGEYMSGIGLHTAQDFGVWNEARIAEVYQTVRSSRPYNKAAYEALNNFAPKDATAPSNKHLNVLRQQMAIDTIRNIKANTKERLFYIEAPTGGGKTNLSMLAVAELLQANPELNKVFYVFPFTTLITQTYEAVKTTLGLSDHEIIQLHSKAGIKEKQGEKKQGDDEDDAQYGDKKLNYIDNLFVNFPMCLLSHVKFFDLLKTCQKESNYLLHRLSNSVVVIDELQSYTPRHWDKIIYFVRQYAHFFNMRFILMSATLPKLGKLRLGTAVKDFVEVLPNAKKDFFRNANFSQRVAFNFDLLEQKKMPLEHLAQHLRQNAQTYAQQDFGKAKPAGSVYVIVEFIFKKSATEFYHTMQALEADAPFFDQIWVLSGTILEHRRKQIINALKNPAYRAQKILLITTQVVEAGVDIDMDLGYKNRSLTDSDEQLAGRINRNVNKQGCTLYLFDYNESRVLYGNDLRYEATQKHLSNDHYQEILRTKDFDRLYEIVLDGIEKLNQSDKQHAQYSLADYLPHIEQLRFEQVDQDFQLIEQANLSVFVPLKVPIKVIGATPNSQEEVFSPQELRFLAQAGIIPDIDNAIDGAEIFALYADLIQHKKRDFIDQKVSLKTLQGILSKFVFSVFDDPKGKVRQRLLRFANPEKFKIQDDGKITVFGYLYLEHYEQIYSETAGLNEQSMDDFDHCIL